MYNIENYLEGKLNNLSTKLFERKFKKNKDFRKKVKLYKSVEMVMRGSLMAAYAKQEMLEKKIDLVAAGLVDEFYANANSKKINESLHWS